MALTYDANALGTGIVNEAKMQKRLNTARRSALLRNPSGPLFSTLSRAGAITMLKECNHARILFGHSHGDVVGVDKYGESFVVPAEAIDKCARELFDDTLDNRPDYEHLIEGGA